MGFFSGFGLGDAISGALGVAGLFGQRNANRRNQGNFETNLAFQRETAQNAHQWQAADLEKAGLNRILSATGGQGARVGGGSALPDIKNEAHSGMAVRLIKAQVDKAQADAKKAQAEAKSVETAIPNIGKQGSLIEAQTRNTSKDTELKHTTKRKVIREILNLRQSVTNMEKDEVIKNFKGLVTELEVQIARTRNQSEKEKLLQLKTQMPRLQADEEFYKTSGPIMKWIDRTLQALSGGKDLIK